MAAVDQLILLRHARAGKKIPNRSRDFERGLDPRGEEAALQLPELIASVLRPTAILSSPYRRCVQTVEPLADALDLRIVNDVRFTPTNRASVRNAFADLPPDSVVCTHGEVIARLLKGQKTCGKGAFWLVERRDGHLLPVRYVEAPTVTQPSIR